MSTIDPGGDNLDPGAVEGMADKVVERRYLYKPKDEEVPPDGANWFEHNYRPMPAAMSIRVSVDIKPLADRLDIFIQNSDMQSVVELCRNAKIEVIATPKSPIVTLKIVP
jgi:hypothetical protein